MEYFNEKVKENKQTNEGDIVITAPRGYINSYYGFIDKLYCLEQTIRKNNFKLIMYSQSVSPLGTRLHMCILSMLSGVPAFNISYEVKGRECYKMMGLSQYSIDYNTGPEKGLIAVGQFINNIDKLRNTFDIKVREMQIEAEKHFRYMIDYVI